MILVYKIKKCKLCKEELDWGKYASKADIKSGICSSCMEKPFPITSVARADLLNSFRPQDLVKFDDVGMERLASKMADAYTGNEVFWIDLQILGENILEG
jgi:hypothetical protein